MRVLGGYKAGNPFTANVTSEAKLDYQSYCPGRNKIIKDYQNINDRNADPGDEVEELIYSDHIQTEGKVKTKSAKAVPPIINFRSPRYISTKILTCIAIRFLKIQPASKVHRKPFPKNCKENYYSIWLFVEHPQKPGYLGRTVASKLTGTTEQFMSMF